MSKQYGVCAIPGYSSWYNMIYRCENKNAIRYHRYGGRGICVCERWRTSFENFLADMGHRPSLDHSIDRIDNDGNYEPGNCRWATRKEQGLNRPGCGLPIVSLASLRNGLTWRGRTLSIARWAKVTGKSSTQIRKRLKRGWSVDKTLSTPTGPAFGHKPKQHA